MSYCCLCLYLDLSVFGVSCSFLVKFYYDQCVLSFHLGDTDQAIMAAARSEMPVLSQALNKKMVIVRSSSFSVRYFPVSVDEFHSR